MKGTFTMDKVRMERFGLGAMFTHAEEAKEGEVGDFVTIGGRTKMIFAIELMKLEDVAEYFFASEGASDEQDFVDYWVRTRGHFFPKKKVWVHFMRGTTKFEMECAKSIEKVKEAAK